MEYNIKRMTLYSCISCCVIQQWPRMRTTSLNGQKIAESRHSTGMSQARFAAMLGVSKDTIISVENGRNRLSASLARRLRFATGGNNLALLEGTGKLLEYHGNSYT